MTEEAEVAQEQAGGTSIPAGADEAMVASTDAGATRAGSEINLDALLDVQVQLSVEIGRSKVPIKQLISLNQGSVIELDRGVNEPLDLLVNGTLMARGEVVVVDGQFGLRLIDIVSPTERLKKLQ